MGMDVDVGANASIVAQPQQQAIQQQPTMQQQQQAVQFAPQQVAAPVAMAPAQLGQATFAPGTQFNLTGPTYIIQRSAPINADAGADVDVEMNDPSSSNSLFPSSAIEPALAASRAARNKGRDAQHHREAPGPVVYLRPDSRPGDDVFFGKAKALALPLPAVLSVLRRESADIGSSAVVEVRNCVDGSRPVEVAVYEDASGSGAGSSKNAGAAWIDYLPSNVVRASLSGPYVALALDTGSILIHSSKTGRRLATLALDSAICFMEVRAPHHLMALTTSGLMHRWNFKLDREVHRPISCLSLLSKQDDVHQVYLHHTGAPVLVLKSAEEAWTVDSAKGSWALLASGWFAECSPLWETRGRGSRQSVTSTPTSTPGLAHAVAAAAAAAVAAGGGAPPPSPGAAGQPSTPGPSATTPAGADISATAPATPASSYTSGVILTDAAGRWREPIRAIESEINSLVVARSSSSATGVSRRHPRPPFDDVARTREFALSASLRHLEVRMTGAVLLNSKDEWVHACRAYAKKLGEEGGLKGLAEELVRELLGPVYQ